MSRKLLSETEAAARLRVSRRRLRDWRSRNRGPAYTHVGRDVLYLEAAVDAFIESQTVATDDSALRFTPDPVDVQRIIGQAVDAGLPEVIDDPATVAKLADLTRNVAAAARKKAS
jgi:excisionase family DNA binding protein